MSRHRFVHRAKQGFWLLLFVAYAALAANVVIDTFGPQYRDLSTIAVTGVDAPAAQRIRGASQAAAVYRANSGMPFSALPPGSHFTVVWPDGSRETIRVMDATSATGVELIEGSAKPAR